MVVVRRREGLCGWLDGVEGDGRRGDRVGVLSSRLKKTEKQERKALVVIIAYKKYANFNIVLLYVEKIQK